MQRASPQRPKTKTIIVFGTRMEADCHWHWRSRPMNVCTADDSCRRFARDEGCGVMPANENAGDMGISNAIIQ